MGDFYDQNKKYVVEAFVNIKPATLMYNMTKEQVADYLNKYYGGEIIQEQHHTINNCVGEGSYAKVYNGTLTDEKNFKKQEVAIMVRKFYSRSICRDAREIMILR